MNKLPEQENERPEILPGAPLLHYEAPELGKNYWVVDNYLTNPREVSNRCFNAKRWKKGLPYTSEKWPGMRTNKALKKAELTQLEDYVKSVTGATKLWLPETSPGVTLDSNVAQLVGEHESSAIPHTDSRNLTRLAAVIYLTPEPLKEAGTSFYRLRYPNGAIGGNMVTEPYNNLRDALKVQRLPAEAWHEECHIENKFNRLLLYKANMVHSASRYFGRDKRDKRLTALFFWMADLP